MNKKDPLEPIEGLVRVMNSLKNMREPKGVSQDSNVIRDDEK